MKPTGGKSVQDLLQRAVCAHHEGRLEAAKALYEQSLAIDAENADALHLMGMLHFHRGEAKAALPLIHKAIARQPGFPPFHDNLAMICMSLGDHEAALEALRTAHKLDAGNGHRCFNIGIAFEQLGRRPEAEAAYRNAVELEPGESDFHFNLGNLLKAEGRAEEAADAYCSALGCDPTAEGTLINLGNLCMEIGRLEEAVECYQTLRKLRPDDADVRAALGQALLASGRFDAAAREFMALLDREPGHPRARRGLASAFRYLEPGAFDARLEKHVAGLFDFTDIHPQMLARIAANQLRYKYAVDQGEGGALLRQPLPRFSQDDLLIRFLTAATNTDPAFEGFISALRRSVLLQIAGSDPIEPEHLKIAVALAEQGCSNEYVCRAERDEFELVAGLVERLQRVDWTIDGLKGRIQADLVGVAMYQPVAGLEFSASIASVPLSAWNWQVRPLLSRVLKGPLREAELAGTIPRVGKIVDEVSNLVRMQYEQHPYPRWRSLHPARRSSYAVALKQMFPHYDPPEFLASGVDVLAAGCGTGQEAAAIAASCPDCRVTGLDLSLASLAYAARMAEELALENLHFCQGDLADTALLGRKFHVIECSGVLHHIAQPEAGWRALAESLRPGGLMKIGLYSELASREVIAARQAIASRGIRPTEGEMRSFREEVLASTPENPLYPLRFSEDLFSMSACRDLLFHAQEQCFTISRISRALERLGLTFVGFELPATEVGWRYRKFNPADSTCTDLEAWERFEAANPRTFSAMYVFWCCRARADN